MALKAPGSNPLRNTETHKCLSAETMNSKFTKVVSNTINIAVSLALVFILSGCVTTQRGGFDKADSPQEAIEMRVAAAKQYLRGRDFESARRHLKSAMELDAKSPDVHEALGLTFQYSGEIELAEKHYKLAINYGNGQSKYRISFSSFLYQAQRFEDAEEQLEKIVDDSLYEQREAALVLLGLSQQQLLKTDKAQRSFERALVLNPRNTRVLRELSIMNYEAKKYPVAWSHFQSYRKVVVRPDAELLLLGIELAREVGDTDSEASFILALKNLYPNSREYQSFSRREQYE